MFRRAENISKSQLDLFQPPRNAINSKFQEHKIENLIFENFRRFFKHKFQEILRKHSGKKALDPMSYAHSFLPMFIVFALLPLHSSEVNV